MRIVPRHRETDQLAQLTASLRAHREEDSEEQDRSEEGLGAEERQADGNPVRVGSRHSPLECEEGGGHDAGRERGGPHFVDKSPRADPEDTSGASQRLGGDHDRAERQRRAHSGQAER